MNETSISEDVKKTLIGSRTLATQEVLTPLLFHNLVEINGSSFDQSRTHAKSWGAQPFEWNGEHWDFAIADTIGVVYGLAQRGQHYVIQSTPFVDPGRCEVEIQSQATNPNLARQLARARDTQIAAASLERASRMKPGERNIHILPSDAAHFHYCSTKTELAELLARPPTSSPILFGPLCLIRRDTPDKAWSAYIGRTELGPVFVAPSEVTITQIDTLLTSLGRRHVASASQMHR